MPRDWLRIAHHVVCRGFMVMLMLMSAKGMAVEGSLWDLSEVEDLAYIGSAASITGAPILLLVSQSDCGYCIQLKAEVLKPLALSGESRNRVILRELTMDEEGVLPDFDGETVTRRAVAYRYQAWVSPTLLFLDDRGAELRQRMVGFQTPEFFGFYLAQAIDDAAARFELRRQ